MTTISKKTIEGFGWSGKISVPRCAITEKRCLITTIFPVDANLGVNKANFFVTRNLKIRVDFSKPNYTQQTFSAVFKNDSPGKTFPGGTYKNFFQLLLPQDAEIISVKKDGQFISDWNRTGIPYFEVFSTLLEIAPQSQTTIEIVFNSNDVLSKDKVYELVLLKQIGLINTNIALEINPPKNSRVRGVNFKLLEKNGVLFYNTPLSTDKLFLVELM